MSNTKKVTTTKGNKYAIIQKISMAVFCIVTLLLLAKTVQLYSMLFSKDLFEAAEWSQFHRYPDYAKYLFVVQTVSLIALIITSRAKKRHQA